MQQGMDSEKRHALHYCLNGLQVSILLLQVHISRVLRWVRIPESPQLMHE